MNKDEDYLTRQISLRPNCSEIPNSWWEEASKNCPVDGISKEIYLAGCWVEERMHLKGCFTDKQINEACFFIGAKLFFTVMASKDVWPSVQRFVQYNCRRRSKSVQV